MGCLKLSYCSDATLSKAIDHLGSGTWITYTDGEAIQHLHYLPFGEEQIDQRLTSFNSRYTFSAKEKDIETNYSYFGARYYNSDLSIWLSVDPLSDKYPSLSPYVYCNNNPVILVDPDGEKIWVIGTNGEKYQYKDGALQYKRIEFAPITDSYEEKVLKDLNTLARSKNKIITGRLNDLIKSEHNHTITSTTGINWNSPLNKKDAANPDKGSGSTTYFNYDKKTKYSDGADFLSVASLAHELLGHAWDCDNGLRSFEKTDNGIPLIEISSVNIQNIILNSFGLKPRTNYDDMVNKKLVPRPIPLDYLNSYFTKKNMKEIKEIN